MEISFKYENEEAILKNVNKGLYEKLFKVKQLQEQLKEQEEFLKKVIMKNNETVTVIKGFEVVESGTTINCEGSNSQEENLICETRSSLIDENLHIKESNPKKENPQLRKKRKVKHVIHGNRKETCNKCGMEMLKK